MTSSRLAWVGLAFVGFVIVTFGAWVMFSRIGVSEASYSCIKEGMTKEEVEAILGDPSAGRPSWRKILIGPRPELPSGGNETRWRDGSEVIIVQFDKNEIVIHKSMHGEPDSLAEKIRTRLGLH